MIMGDITFAENLRR